MTFGTTYVVISERGKEGKSCWNKVIKFFTLSVTTSLHYHMTVLQKYLLTWVMKI